MCVFSPEEVEVKSVARSQVSGADDDLEFDLVTSRSDKGTFLRLGYSVCENGHSNVMFTWGGGAGR